MAKDRQVVTWLSKQIAFDKAELVALATDEQTDYNIVCLSPLSVAYLMQLAVFYAEWENRWIGFTISERNQLVADTVRSLSSPMACSEDIAAIITELQVMNSHLADLVTKMGDLETTVSGDFATIDATLATIKTAVDSAFPDSIFDELEPILDGVGTILGAPVIGPTP